MKSAIRERLYIGSYSDAAQVFSGEDKEITHILSVIQPSEMDSKAGHTNSNLLGTKVVPIDDYWFENLLDRLEECTDFINNSLQQKEAAILVHCMSGSSRSVSVVIAYLMRKEHLSVNAALKDVRRSRLFAKPNDGFLDQLRLFEKMGCKIDKSFIGYKAFRAKELYNLHCRKGYPITVSQLAAVEDGSGEYIRCQTCQNVVASMSSLVHKNPKNKPDCGGGHYVEPVQWMMDAIAECSRGNLNCAGCGALLGAFDWDGGSCYCGITIAPEFKLTVSNVSY